MKDQHETGLLSGTRTLCAVLLNPALREQASTTTYRNAQAAVPMVGCERLVIANLLDVPTKDAPALNTHDLTAAEAAKSWQALASAVQGADEVLLAWGMGGMTGRIRVALQQQVDWLHETLLLQGFPHVWTVAGQPRHPSRWRQYVGPEKQRVEGSCFEERLRKVLLPVPFRTDDGRALFTHAFGTRRTKRAISATVLQPTAAPTPGDSPTDGSSSPSHPPAVAERAAMLVTG